MGKRRVADAIPPGDLERMLADGGLLADMAAAAERASGLLERHGMIVREPDGLRPNRRFMAMWIRAEQGPGTLLPALSWAIREWTGGALDGQEASSACVEFSRMLHGTELGDRIDAEVLEWVDRNGPVTYDAARELRRARAGPGPGEK